jgi:type I restriction-modification system DNA methylase subunit
MSKDLLNESEKASLKHILEDLRLLFEKEEIQATEFDNIIASLKSEEVGNYVKHLQVSKPETALREAFIAGRSVLLKYLCGTAAPEARSNGFIDYLIKDETGRGVAIELKPLFEADVERDKAGRSAVKRLRQKRLEPSHHEEQVLKYIRSGEALYVILTNLKDWYFYSKESDRLEPFHKTDLFGFIAEYDITGSLWGYLERKEYESVRYDLDKRFLDSLELWVAKLSEVEFTVDEKRKLELIIWLINKFIFVQTLDDYGVIEFNWIKKRWDHHERMWQRKGRAMVLEKFFEELDEWFYLYYDTELFKTKLMDHVKRDEENVGKLYQNLQLVLGFSYLQAPSVTGKGIMQYNFRHIDEDVLGKAYETFLAEVRKDEGIYYTPRYVTQYIAETIVEKLFDGTIERAKDCLLRKDYVGARDEVVKMTSIRVLDPACGSGSFLVKALRVIMARYRDLKVLLDDLIKKHSNYRSLHLTKEDAEQLEHLQEIKRILGAEDERGMIAKILLRHIYGVDLDRRALEVTKVNLWLEAIKLAPKEFRYDRLPSETNYVLPNLEMNLRTGDALVGLPEAEAVSRLSTNHKQEIARLSELRREYLDNPAAPSLIEEINGIKERIGAELDDDLSNLLRSRGLQPPGTKPLHWPLEFWFAYFESTGDPLAEGERGLDGVIGNPPYERIQVLKKKSPPYVEYLNASYETALKNYDLAVIFIERGLKLLRKGGQFGYIVTSKFMQADYGEALRGFLSERKAVWEIVDFGDQQVFAPEATTYTALIFLSNDENKTIKYAKVKRLARSLEQFMKLRSTEKYEDDSIVAFPINIKSLTEQPWSFTPSVEKEVFDKTGAATRGCTLKDVADRIFVGLQTSADQVYALELKEDLGSSIRVYSKSQGRDYVLEKGLLKPLLMGKDIKRWCISNFKYVLLFPYKIEGSKAKLIEEETLSKEYPRIWKYLIDNRSQLEKRERGSWAGRPDWYGYIYLKNMDKFGLPKIMTQVLASRSSFAIDDKGLFYFTGGGGAAGYGVTIKADVGVSLEFICALLNSSLLDWYLKKISTVYRGGFYVYAKRFIEKLPIKVPQTDEEQKSAREIEGLVKNIMALKRTQNRLIDLWKEWSERLRSGRMSLMEILSQDLSHIREGETGKAWTSRASFYPSESREELNKTFAQFKVRGEVETPNLKIYGINGESQELLYELEFEDRDLMLHAYCSLQQTLASKRVNTLEQLLAKTEVSIIKEVNRTPKELTPNIMKRVKQEIGGESGDKGVETDIVEIDTKIEDEEAKIDALVFKIYGLNEADIRTIFASLKAPTHYQAKVLAHFSSLKEQK